MPPSFRAGDRLVFVLPVALLALGFAARGMAARAWTAFTRYESPFAFKNPEPRRPPALTDQVVIVLVDGLTLGASRSMPFLNELRARGADLECRIGLPSLSQPARAVMMTGAWQEIHGQTTNFNPRPLAVEHLFQAARGGGLRTALAAGQNAHKLFAPHATERLVYPRPVPGEDDFSDYEAQLRRVGEATRALLREKRPNLFLIDYSITDQAGHQWGARSPQYRRGAELADEEIRALAGEVDLGRGVLIVTADHGHIPEGGHGGGEADVMSVPLVLAGPAVSPRARGAARQIDIAPTVAALLGLPIPASNQGRILTEVLSLDEAQRRAALEALHAQRARFVSSYVAWVRGRPVEFSGQDGQDIEARLGDLDRKAGEAREARRREERRRRGWEAAAVLLALTLGFALAVALGITSAGELALAFVFGLLAAGVYFLSLGWVGLGYSITVVNDDDWLPWFFRKDMALGISSCLLAVGAAAAWSRRRQPSLRFRDLARLSWLIAAAFCSPFVVKIAAVYWWHGIFLRWSMPDPYWGFGFYLDVLVVMAVGFTSLLLPLVAWFAARVAPVRTAGKAP